jgi:hypothetical protein
MFALLCCMMIVTENNVISAGVHANGSRQQPQVRQLQEAVHSY